MQVKLFYIIIVATIFQTEAVNAQRLMQLTNDSKFDYMPDFYNNRIAWIKNTVYGETEIFLAEGNNIKQITNSKIWKASVRVGQKYIIWSENDPSKSSKNYLMCYDGEKAFCLDTSSITFESLNTATNIVFWRKETDNSYIHYWWDGENRHIFRQNLDYKMIGNLTSTGMFYSYRKDSIHYLAHTNFIEDEIIDSCNGCWISFKENLNGGSNYVNIDSKDKGKTLYYDKIYNGTSFQHIFLIDGLKNYLSNGRTNRYYDDRNLYVGRDYLAFWNTIKPDSLTFWRNGKFMTIGSLPFKSINSFADLNNITFGFLYNDDEPGEKISIFSRNKIYTYTVGLFNFSINRIISFGNSVAWSSASTPFGGNNLEIYYFNDEKDSQKISAKPIVNFSAKIYHKNIARQIAVELETPQAENYSLTVYNYSGKIIEQLNFSAPVYGKQYFTFTTENFAAGPYIVRLQNTSVPEQILTAKLLIPERI